MTTLPEGLRELADMFEKLGDELPTPYFTGNDVWLSFWSDDAAEKVRDAAKLIGGRWHKNDPKNNDWDASTYTLTNDHKFGPLKLMILAHREKVCERVQVGTERIEVEAQPAVEAHVEERPVYDWVCSPLIKKVDELAAAGKEITITSETPVSA